MSGPKMLRPPETPLSQGLRAAVPDWLSWAVPTGDDPAEFVNPMPTGPVGGLAGAIEALAPLLGTLVIKGLGQAGELSAPLGNLLRPVGQRAYGLAAPVLRRMEAALKAGEGRPAEWTRGERIVEAIGPQGGHTAEEMARKYNRGWGATSPNTDFVRNTEESLDALSLYLQDQPLSLENLRARGVTQAPSKQPNLQRAYVTDEPLQAWGGPRGGPGKAEAMAGFMTGEDRIPIDVHTLDVLGADQDTFSAMLSGLRALMTEHEGLPARGGLTNSDIYNRSEDAVRRGLQDITGTAYRPRMDFAQMWEGVRGLKGLKYDGGMIDWLARHGLLDPGAMGSPARIDEVLGGLRDERKARALAEATRRALRQEAR